MDALVQAYSSRPSELEPSRLLAACTRLLERLPQLAVAGEYTQRLAQGSLLPSKTLLRSCSAPDCKNDHVLLQARQPCSSSCAHPWTCALARRLVSMHAATRALEC